MALAINNKDTNDYAQWKVIQGYYSFVEADEIKPYSRVSPIWNLEYLQISLDITQRFILPYAHDILISVIQHSLEMSFQER